MKTEKHFYDRILNELKGLRKDFKKNISSDPSVWDITELEAQKALIKNLTQSKLKNLMMARKNTIEVKHLHSDLIVEGIDMIEELVSSFKLTTASKSA